MQIVEETNVNFNSKYGGGYRFNWAELTDGQARKFVKGEDYANKDGRSDKYISNQLKVSGKNRGFTAIFGKDKHEKREHFILKYVKANAPVVEAQQTKKTTQQTKKTKKVETPVVDVESFVDEIITGVNE